MNKKTKFEDLGLIDFKKCWDYQENIFNHIISVKSHNRKNKETNPTNNYLLFCEHPHVYTIGKSGNINNLLIEERFLSKKGANLYKINRGGDITYHGPGQIVGYPILDLENFFTDISRYLRSLEEVVILTLEHYGIKGERSKGETGVWLDVGTSNARKICAFGVKSSRWVTMHGFALNVNVDLDYFNYIVPCGIKDKKVTSLSAELKQTVCTAALKKLLLQNLEFVFNMQFFNDEKNI